MADYTHGEMDTKTQEQTFDGFMKFTTRAVIAIIVLFVFMAIFAI